MYLVRSGSALSVVLLLGLVGMLPAAAQTTDGDANGAAGEISAGPSITISPATGQLGDHIQVVFDGWTAANAELSICGNLALRGSADCNTMLATGVRLRHSTTGETPLQSMVVVAPPVDCPCVVKASASDTGELAYAPIEIAGQLISPVIEPAPGQPLVAVTVDATEQNGTLVEGLQRSLGGPSRYTARVTVRNLMAQTLSGVQVDGTVRRRDVAVADFGLHTGEIGPGQTWTGTAEVTLPAPAIGTYRWSTTASGAGPIVDTETTTRSVPKMFVLLFLVFVGVVAAVAVRAIQRRRHPTRGLPVSGLIDPDGLIDIGGRVLPAPPTVAAPPPSELVGVGRC